MLKTRFFSVLAAAAMISVAACAPDDEAEIELDDPTTEITPDPAVDPLPPAPMDTLMEDTMMMDTTVTP